jgi:AraC-like DNA-binding protein
MYHSQSLHRAIERLIRYSNILSDAIQIKVIDGEEADQVVLDNEPESRVLRHPVDSRLAAVLSIAREISSSDIVPVEVCFCYPEPQDTSAHREFFRAPLSFGQPDSMLVLRKRDMNLPVVSADETLSGYLDRLADETLQMTTPRGSFVERVQRAIWSKLSGGQPTLRRMAEILGVSVRTLQRRLGEEGTSFAAVLDGLRRHMSVRLLNNRELAVYEVAYLLGYSEPSTFFRAFRRWHGIPPAEYRKLTNKGAAASEESTAPGGEVS